MEDIIKCDKCGKEFCSARDLNRHKNRKIPCIVGELPAEIIDYNCNYCNHIFSKKENLTRHLKTCARKIAELEMSDDDMQQLVRDLSQKVSTLDEKYTAVKTECNEMKIECKELKTEYDEMKKECNELKTEYDDLRKECATLRKEIKDLRNNLIGDLHINFGTINNINTPINDYRTPNIDHLIGFESFRSMLLKSEFELPVKLIFNIYFDPSHPENAAVHLIDKETKHVLVMVNGKWNTFTMEKIVAELREVGYNCVKRGLEVRSEDPDHDMRKDFLINNIQYIDTMKNKKISHGAIAYDYQCIEQKLFDEYVASSKHPAVIAEKFRIKKAIAAAKSQYL